MMSKQSLTSPLLSRFFSPFILLAVAHCVRNLGIWHGVSLRRISTSLCGVCLFVCRRELLSLRGYTLGGRWRLIFLSLRVAVIEQNVTDRTADSSIRRRMGHCVGQPRWPWLLCADGSRPPVTRRCSWAAAVPSAAPAHFLVPFLLVRLFRAAPIAHSHVYSLSLPLDDYATVFLD